MYTNAKNDLISCADRFVGAPLESQYQSLKTIMEGNIPCIGRPRVYEWRRHGKSTGRLPWTTIYNWESPNPLLLLLTCDSNHKHAICVVDDVVFDPAVKYPMKLIPATLDWISEVAGCKILMGLHFNETGNGAKKRILRECRKHFPRHVTHDTSDTPCKCHQHAPP